jgi:hypothetical protein
MGGEKIARNGKNHKGLVRLFFLTKIFFVDFCQFFNFIKLTGLKDSASQNFKAIPSKLKSWDPRKVKNWRFSYGSQKSSFDATAKLFWQMIYIFFALNI